MSVVSENAVEYETMACGRPAEAHVSHFVGESGVEEFHIVVRPTRYAPIDVQLEWLSAGYSDALECSGLDPESAVMRRFFCSDPSNQAPWLEACGISRQHGGNPCAVSWVRQPPPPPAKVALWAYHVCDPRGPLNLEKRGDSLFLRRGDLAHIWSTGLTAANAETPHDQTRAILAKYDSFLRENGLMLADHVIRTWFLVQSVDTNYRGFVQARREFFEKCGLVPETHFIASTGIEGANVDVAAKVMLDAYAISGVQPRQIEFLAALDHLSPTHVYGVTFERGTSVAYRDRKHVFISGTASIDHQGRTLHPGDVTRQLDRTIENIEALLRQAGAGLGDVGVFIVYVRDASDHEIVLNRMRERVGNAPIQLVVAPVCRPGWLVEVEAVATIDNASPELPAF